jgi:urocanate reductase
LTKKNSEGGGINRRAVIATGGAVGVGVVAAPSAEAAATRWNRTVDVIVVGSGAAGLPAAIRARDLGASVLVVEMNDDVGGHAIISNAFTNLGGGNAMQQKYGIVDTPDDIYLEYTRPDHAMTRYNDRAMVRAFADYNVEVYDFLVAKGVMFRDARPTNSPSEGSAIPRRIGMETYSDNIRETINGTGGSGYVRPLEHAARAAGVEFLLSHQMVRIVREDVNAGPVQGIEVLDRVRNRRITIRARRGVIACTGGSSSNVAIRTIYDPRLTDEYQVGCEPYSPQSGDAEQLGMAVGASLGGTAGQRNETYLALQKTAFIGCQYGYARWDPNSPYFQRARASGLAVADYQDAILVNAVGERFYDETVTPTRVRGDEGWSALQGYFSAALSSAVKVIDGKKHRIGGPVWAIFDAEGAAREEWTLTPPHVDPDYFFSASTLGQLAAQLNRNVYQARHPMSGVTLAESVARYNGFVDAGADADFRKPTPRYKIQTPPFYAAWATPILHDTYAGLRVNANWQVMDVFGAPITGFYCAGESAGGFTQHGVARCAVGGYIAATHAVGA